MKFFLFLIRKRSIRQIIETIRSFENLLEQEERRFQTFETLRNLFNEILSRTASVDHLNDLAVKLIEELKVNSLFFTQCMLKR